MFVKQLGVDHAFVFIPALILDGQHLRRLQTDVKLF